MARVLTAGVAVADFIFQIGEFPRTAEKYRAINAFISGGGNAANSAVAISRMGGDAILAARIGGDFIGDFILSELESEGVDTHLIQRTENARSSYSSIYVDAIGERQIMNFRGSGLAEDANWLDNPPRIDAVLADNRWAPITKKAVAIARERNIPSILDVEAPIEVEALAGASHLAFSAQGLADFADGLAVDDALQKAREISLAWVCVTNGANGVRYLGKNGFGYVDALAVKPIETLGAGDVWHGAFALCLAEGESEVEAVKFANCAASVKCTKPGGRKSYPDRNTITEKLSENTK